MNKEGVMKMRYFAILLLSLLAGSPTDASTLFFAGDSTLDDAGYSLEGTIREPYRSWGSELVQDLKAGHRIANYARSGASTKSFVKSGMWAKLIAEVKHGDFVAIQFGPFQV